MPTPAELLELQKRINAQGVLIADLEKIAKEANVWDGNGTQTIASLKELLLLPENLEKAWPHRDLLPVLPPDPALPPDSALPSNPALPPDPVRLQMLRDALDTSTKVNRTLGLSFVALMFYILLIIASTTDLMLFLPESTVRLPIIDVELPLLGFYTVVPYLIVLFHFNLLINLRQHQMKYKRWRAEAGKDADSNLLDPFMVNFIDGIERKSFLRYLVIAMIATSIFYFPLINLIAMQWRFGDYHSFGISTAEFVATLLDVGLALGFMHQVIFRTPKGWRLIVRPAQGFTLGAALVGGSVWFLALYLHMQLIYPESWNWIAKWDLPRIDLTNQEQGVGEVADGYVLHYLRDSADVDFARREAHRNFGKGLVLEGRDFRYAIMNNVNLAGANLVGCRMDGVKMIRAVLEGARLERAHLEDANLSAAHLEGVRLWEAHLEGAELSAAHLEGAILSAAHLEGAGLSDAHLEGANLSHAHLEGADIERSHFEGAFLWGAHLEVANLSHAHLEGADLSAAHLEGAELSQAHLEGAELWEAHLEGANLSGALLKAAFFEDSYVVGSKIDWAMADSIAYIAYLDWNTLPKWDAILHIKNSIPAGEKKKEFIFRILEAEERYKSYSAPNRSPTGISLAARRKMLPAIACRSIYVGNGILTREERRYSFMIPEEPRDSGLAQAMCATCPGTLKAIYKKWPEEFDDPPCK